jgi:hypothetical protein
MTLNIMNLCTQPNHSLKLTARLIIAESLPHGIAHREHFQKIASTSAWDRRRCRSVFNNRGVTPNRTRIPQEELNRTPCRKSF